MKILVLQFKALGDTVLLIPTLFDRSVDFGGNDRGSTLSWLCGARRRLGPMNRGGSLWRHRCYTERVDLPKTDRHEALRLLDLLSSWGVSPHEINEIQIATDPALDPPAQALLPTPGIICHLGAGCSKKQWLLRHWVAFHPLALRAGYPLVFTTGMGAREQHLAEQLKRCVPEAVFLPSVPDLALFLAVLKRARALITGDTGQSLRVWRPWLPGIPARPA